MRVVIVEKPAPFVSLAEARRAARVEPDNTDDDDVLEGFIAAACQKIDGPRTAFRRAIGIQVVELFLDRFGTCPVALPGRNTLEVLEVGFLNGSGIPQIAPPDLYELRGDELGSAWGKSWPATLNRPEAVRIKYRAGYGKQEGNPLAWVADVPAPIKTAVLMHVAHLYANREAASAETMAAVPFGYHDLLSDYRVWSI